MNDSLDIWQRPTQSDIAMIAGWHQWADAGNISSGLPYYLINALDAQRIGTIRPEGFYLFQMPGTHHFFRPEIKLRQGLIESLEQRENDFFYWSNNDKGLVIFLGQEPHLNADRYCAALLDAADALGVKRLLSLGGVYGSMPYDRDREIHCVYSLPVLKDELDGYGVSLSNYEGGATIGVALAYAAQQRGAEVIDWYGFVPAYDFSELSNTVQGMRIDNDFKSWHELLLRFNRMLGLDLDLSDLAQRSKELVQSMDAKIDELDRRMPHLKVKDYMARLSEGFTEPSDLPMDDLWAEELGDLLDTFDD
jgi:proteasome assembly chaperone (PAC2) family protein